MRLAIVSTVFAAWIGLAASALAEDFTFHVPVRIENMRFAESGIVLCSVVARGRSIAAPAQPFTVVDGAYRATHTFAINLGADVRRDEATRYSCVLNFSYRNSEGVLLNATSSGLLRQAEVYTRDTGQAVTAQNIQAAGDWPRR